jgi:hypothetical protein
MVIVNHCFGSLALLEVASKFLKHKPPRIDLKNDRSFLTYNIITSLTAQTLQSDGTKPPVGYFFFGDNNHESFRHALREVAYQISQRDREYSKHLDESIISESQMMSVSLAWHNLFATYWLHGQDCKPAYIIFDGLDEASSQERREFLEVLDYAKESDSRSKLRIVMLGRPHIINNMTLANIEGPPTIHVNSTKNGDDIKSYVRSSITKSKALKRVRESLKQKIVDTLTLKAGGMFMWVRLMVEELNKAALRGREFQIEKALSEAPRDLTRMTNTS